MAAEERASFLGQRALPQRNPPHSYYCYQQRERVYGEESSAGVLTYPSQLNSSHLAAMSAPIVPSRPQRAPLGTTAVNSDMPSIPPRPVRKVEPSPDRDLSTRSPLNLPPGGALARPPSASHGRSEADLPRRPPSVSLPGIGQEGAEYSSYDELPPEAHGFSRMDALEPTKSVTADLPIHQPVASVPRSTAKRQIQAVTRTDSASAAAAGLGRHQPIDEPHQPPTPAEYPASPLSRTVSNSAGGRRPSSVEPHPLRAKASFNRSTSSIQPLERSTSRPSSIHGGDHDYDIPRIGRQIPLHPNAGDVQAPSPDLTQPQYAPGIGFFNDGSRRTLARKRSSRQDFGPPDSYGIRHDHDHQDQFEKDWQAKHPQEAAKEDYHLHVPRPPSALTSEQLNRLVGQSFPGSNSKENGGAPDEEDVLDATEEYNLRKSPLNPSSELHLHKARSELESDLDDDHVIHVYPGSRRISRISVGSADHAYDTDHHGDHGYGSDRDTPILASDEVIKRPNSAFMHAAVNPADANGDESYESDHGFHGEFRRSSASRPSSRPSSMHGSYHGGPLHRFISHEEQPHSGVGTPLEEIEEYDPLFPDDEDGKSKPKKALARRPDMAHMHHFPSQDVWEDTPASLQYSAEVSTPEVERSRTVFEGGSGSDAAQVFETPEQEQQRRADNPDTMTSDKKTFVKPHYKSDLHERPGVPRFPSSDVWEDTPDSMRLETTVSGPQTDDTGIARDDKPTTNAISSAQDPDARSSTGASSIVRPSIPARPTRQSRLAQEVTPEALDNAQALSSTDTAKPAIPSRPVRTSAAAAATNETTGPAAPIQKAKPTVPARPAGKFGGLGGNAGFLSDLNNRLKLGPQGPPASRKEIETDAAVVEETAKAAPPLADARKGRAKGPLRRKPASGAATTELKSSSFALSPLITVWSIDEEDELQVDSSDRAAAEANLLPSTKDTATQPLEVKVEAARAVGATADIEQAAGPPTTMTETPEPVAAGSGTFAAEVMRASDKEQREMQDGLLAALAEKKAAPPQTALGGGRVEAATEERGLTGANTVDDRLQGGLPLAPS